MQTDFFLTDPKERTQNEWDLFFMHEALKEAKKAFDQDEVPVGAVIVHNKKIIARAHNQVEMLKDATAHAEMLCLTSASELIENWRLVDTTLYTTLEPCIMCAGALFLSRVKRVIFGAPDLRMGAAGSFVDLFSEIKFPTHSIVIEGGILEKLSSDLLQKFFQKQRSRFKKNCLL